ncbi:hypothetical protein [Taylorella asinigenitalis]|uniref:hypothetical protein n=1 Tax=Taylorella asinigenitalis TaxID=84590 RepID=UPI000491879E|nr:hypothetical protein [Taylorella asinigenitalis]
MKLYITAPILCAVLAACQSSPQTCDPNVEMNFFDKLGCSTSGSYDKRIEQKEANLNAEQYRNKQLNYKKSQLESKRKATRAQRNAKQRESNRLSTLNKKMQEDLNNKKRAQSAFRNSRSGDGTESIATPSEDNSLKAKRLQLEKLRRSNKL